ncbi:MFS general substrate transporter [Ramicandelaber brevisporus]|nr:MFS general substrate transporter [Ramicandelaber brevisporus]
MNDSEKAAFASQVPARANSGDEDPYEIEQHAVVNSLEHEPPLTNRETYGWYAYGWASEPYSAVITSVFTPIVLESLASSAGFESDLTTPCDSSKDDYKCYVKLGGSWVSTASYPLFINAIAVLIQAVVYIGVGSLADHGNFRKTLMLSFAAVGAIITMLNPAAHTPNLYWLVATFSVCANVCYGASTVFYYAFVPTFTRVHPDVKAAHATGDKKEILRANEIVGNGLSSKAFAIGYAAGVLMLIIGAIIVYFMDQTTLSMQIAVCLVGVWWFAWSFVPLFFLHPRPGPPLPKGENYFLYSYKTVGRTLLRARKLSMTFRFLIAWFFMADAVSTITSVAVIFAKTTLKAKNIQLLIAAIIVPLAALIGNLFWMFLQRKTGLMTKRMLLIILGLFTLLPIWGLIGFGAPVGLKSIKELYGVAAVDGFLLGAFQSYCRVQYSQLVPPGHENEFFSLYGITDKGSSWLGPLCAGAIATATGNMRYAFIFLLAIMLVPMAIVATVDVERGRRDAAAFVGIHEEPEKIEI